jgi:hypothetical protein
MDEILNTQSTFLIYIYRERNIIPASAHTTHAEHVLLLFGSFSSATKFRSGPQVCRHYFTAGVCRVA